MSILNRWADLPFTTITLGLATFLAGAAPSAAETKTRFFQTADKRITAYFIGPRCGEKVELLLQSDDPDEFIDSRTPASRMMNNASKLLSKQCRDLERILGKGVVDSRVLYSGIAEAASQWQLVEVGARRTGLLAAGDSDHGERKRFAGTAGFLRSDQIESEINGRTFCVNPDPTNSCTAESSFRAAPSGMRLRARYLMEETGEEAVLSYPAAHDSNGFLCSATRDVDVEVLGGDLQPKGRAELARLLKEQVVSGGDHICAGFMRDSQSRLVVRTFNEQGSALEDGSPMVPQVAPVRLRLGD